MPNDATTVQAQSGGVGLQERGCGLQDFLPCQPRRAALVQALLAACRAAPEGSTLPSIPASAAGGQPQHIVDLVEQNLITARITAKADEMRSAA